MSRKAWRRVKVAPWLAHSLYSAKKMWSRSNLPAYSTCSSKAAQQHTGALWDTWPLIQARLSSHTCGLMESTCRSNTLLRVNLWKNSLRSWSICSSTVSLFSPNSLSQGATLSVRWCSCSISTTWLNRSERFRKSATNSTWRTRGGSIHAISQWSTTMSLTTHAASPKRCSSTWMLVWWNQMSLAKMRGSCPQIRLRSQLRQLPTESTALLVPGPTILRSITLRGKNLNSLRLQLQKPQFIASPTTTRELNLRTRGRKRIGVRRWAHRNKMKLM